MEYGALSQNGKILATLMEIGPMTHLELSRTIGVPKKVIQAKFVYLRRKNFVRKINETPPYLWKVTVPKIPAFLKTRGDGSFNELPSSSLAYVLGVCFGDASVCRYRDNHTRVYRYVISLEVPERELAVSFRDALRKIRLNPSFSFFAKKNVYRVRVYSKQFYQWFDKLTPKDLKKMLCPVFGQQFVRGFYESEGCISKIVDRRCSNFWRHQLIMGCTNRQIVELVQRMLKGMGFLFHFGEYHHPSPKAKALYRIYIYDSGQEKIRCFINKIKPCVKNSFPD